MRVLFISVLIVLIAYAIFWSVRSGRARAGRSIADADNDSFRHDGLAGHTPRTRDDYFLQHRVVVLEGVIDDESASILIARLLLLESSDRRAPIQLHINSPGGNVSAGLAIIDTMNYLDPPIHTLCRGMAAGMAALMLGSGQRGNRRAFRDARIILTPTASGTIPPDKREIYEQELVRMNRAVVSCVVAITSQPEEVVRTDVQRGRAFIPRQAKEYGLIDEILG